MNKELEIFQDKDGNVYNIETELEHKLILCIVEQQEKLDKIKEYCETERVNILTNFEYLETTDLDNILKLLEEIE